jgi:hypothetical protein
MTKWRATLQAKLYQQFIEVPVDDVEVEVLEAVSDTREGAIDSVFGKLHEWHFGDPISSNPEENYHDYVDVKGFRACCLAGTEPEIGDINGYIPKWKNLQHITSTLQVSEQ